MIIEKLPLCLLNFKKNFLVTLLFVILSLLFLISLSCNKNPNAYIFVGEWGNSGKMDGDFSSPISVAIYEDRYIYVVDSWNHCVQKFDTEGTFILKWGSQGTGDGEFIQPLGRTSDNKGNIYVIASHNDCIQKFDNKGNFITRWGEVGSEEGQFSFPNNIALDSKGYVYIADTNNGRVQIFAPGFPGN